MPTAYSNGYRWFNMGNRPLEHDVMSGNGVLIPAGTKRVKIAFRQSHLTRIDEATGKRVKMNVYMWKNKLYHA